MISFVLFVFLLRSSLMSVFKSSSVAKSKLHDEGVQSPKVIPQETDEPSEEEEHCVCCTLGSNKQQKQL